MSSGSEYFSALAVGYGKDTQTKERLSDKKSRWNGTAQEIIGD